MMEAEFNQSKNRVTIDRVVTISLLQDVLKTCANWVCMELTCWDMDQGNPPIIYQLVMNFVRFMALERVKTCTNPYGMCPKKHKMLEKLSDGDKDVLTDFVVTTEGVWFNQKCVKTLEASKAWKIGDKNGHGTP